MAQHAGRITCPRCGTNNFDNMTNCWKCNNPLVSGMGAASERAMAPAGYAPSPISERAFSAPVFSNGDPNVAHRAAIALALVIPWVGLPVGWVFMMIEDSRKQAVGRVCVVWSSIALFFHLLLMYAFAASAASLLRQVVLPAISGAVQNMNRGNGGGGMPGGGDLSP